MTLNRSANRQTGNGSDGSSGGELRAGLAAVDLAGLVVESSEKWASSSGSSGSSSGDK